MGLDIVFNARSKLDPRYKEEVGYFAKVNFILTYFGISDDRHCDIIEIPHYTLHTFVNDLHKEILIHNTNKTTVPTNPRLKTKNVFFGGCTDYGRTYWEDVNNVYNCMKELDEGKHIDWNKDTLEMFFSW